MNTRTIKIPVSLILCAVAWAATLYWSPHHSCVRAQVGAGMPEADAQLVCGHWLKQN